MEISKSKLCQPHLLGRVRDIPNALIKAVISVNKHNLFDYLVVQDDLLGIFLFRDCPWNML